MHLTSGDIYKHLVDNLTGRNNLFTERREETGITVIANDMGSESKRKSMDTIAELFDKLTIVNLKIFKYEDIKRMPCVPDKDIADATRATNILNTQRGQLKNEINEFFKSGTSEVKSYGKTI